MGNLGQYQMITTLSKKVGGPVKLLVYTGIVGYGIFRLGEAGIKKIINVLNNQKLEDDIEYIVTAEAVVGDRDYGKESVQFVKNDRFKVLFQDGDAVMIEKVGGRDNPYIVSASFLSEISSFNNA